MKFIYTVYACMCVYRGPSAIRLRYIHNKREKSQTQQHTSLSSMSAYATSQVFEASQQCVNYRHHQGRAGLLGPCQTPAGGGGRSLRSKVK